MNSEMNSACGRCVHADVCKYRGQAEAVVLTILDLRETKEMQSGAFKVYMKCKYYISTETAKDFEERR